MSCTGDIITERIIATNPVCRNGQVTTLTGTDYLVILDGDDNVRRREQRLGVAEDIKVAPHRILRKIDLRNKFGN